MNGVARDERIKAVIPRPNVYQYGDNFKRFVQRMKDYCILSEIKHNLHLFFFFFATIDPLRGHPPCRHEPWLSFN